MNIWKRRIKKNGIFNVSNHYDSKSFVQVECDTLDNVLNFIEKTTYDIKINIQGEVNAWLGANKTLKNTRRIIVEVHNEDNLEKVEQILITHNFDIEKIKSHLTFLVGTKISSNIRTKVSKS